MFGFLHLLLQVAGKKPSRTMLVNPWKIMKSKNLKLIKETTAYFMSAIFVDALSCMKKVDVTMFQILTTITQSVTLRSMIPSHFFVKHKMELLNCEVCENYFKTEDNLAGHDATIHNKGCGKIFKNNNIYQLNSLFNIYGSCDTL